ncbi:MAG: hypothetical protein JO088_21800 [Acidobacteria bacterium]|nr:hypothetical protein [Acidobacteriota bacterium]MBV9067628.1 hypothetical protein [Acidobacteriota bacterium]
MARHAALFAALGFLLISGCATTPARRSTPVAITVTSDPGNNLYELWFRDTTLDAIAKQVPNAHPMTINVKLDIASRFKETPTVISSEPARAEQGQAAPEFNFRSPTSEQITSYRVVYTISDAAGQVVESNQLTLDNGHLVDARAGARLKERYGPVGDTAMFLASRVKTLDQ